MGRTTSRPGPPRRRAWTRPRILFVAAAMLLLSSCSWTSGDQYFIHWGLTRDDVIIREASSWDLTLARELFYIDNDQFQDDMGGFTCHAHADWKDASTCVLRLLNGRTDIPELGKGVWRRATDYEAPVNVSDFHGSIGRVNASADDKAQLSDCETLSISPISFNWTERSRSDSNCRVGHHSWE